MAPRKGFKTYFSQGQNRSYKYAPDNFNPFLGLSDDIDALGKNWKKGGINIFLFVGGVDIDLEALIKAYPGSRGVLSGGRIRPRQMQDIIKLKDALKVTEAFLKDKKLLQDITQKAYLRIVPKELDKYLTAKKARHIISVGGAEEQTPGAKAKFQKTFWQVSKRGVYSKLWEKVVAIILDGLHGRAKYLKKVGTGVESFSMNDLMSIEVERSKSKYRTVFLMEEFGTGQFAEPNKRVYQGKGSTLYKVPPYLIQAVSGKLKKKDILNATAAWYINRGSLAYGEGQYKVYLKLKNKKGKKGLADRALRNLSRNIENWTYGYAGGHHKGREALHLFFEKGGIVEAIRLIQFKAQEEIVKIINEEIKKKAPEFPGLIAKIVSRG